MTLSIGGTDYAITIDATNDSLDGLAAAINASDSGATASIIADEGGYRMIVKGTTGAANGFTLAADGGADPGLTAFAYGTGGGMRLGQAAADAKFTKIGRASCRDRVCRYVWILVVGG